MRFAVAEVGYRLGWASIVVVLVGLALDPGARRAEGGTSAEVVFPTESR